MLKKGENMGLKDIWGKITTTVKHAVMVHKSKSQTKKTDFTGLADDIGTQFAPDRSDGRIPGVVAHDYEAAGSTEHVEKNELAGIYFTDVISRTLSDAMVDQYKNEYRSKYVYIPQEAMDEILGGLSPEEKEELVARGIIDKHGKMTVENYRKWQMQIIADREKALPGNAPEKVFGDIQAGFEEHLHEKSAREWARQFYEDETDQFGIAERFGGNGKGCREVPYFHSL